MKMKKDIEKDNLEELRVIMFKNKDTRTSLAKYLKLDKATLSKRLSGELEFKSSEIKKISEKYNFDDSEIVYFFSLKST